MGMTLQCYASPFWYKCHSAGTEKLNATKTVRDYRCVGVGNGDGGGGSQFIHFPFKDPQMRFTLKVQDYNKYLVLT